MRDFYNFIMSNRFILCLFFLLLSVILNAYFIFIKLRKPKAEKQASVQFDDNYKYNLDFFKELYKDELDKKDKINAKVAIPSSILLLLLSGEFYYISYLKNLTKSVWSNIFYSFFIIYTLSLILITVFVIKAYINYKYKVIHSPLVFDEYTSELQKYYNEYYESYYYKDSGYKSKEVIIKDQLDKYKYRSYLYCTEFNTKLNSKKLACLKYISWFLIAALISGVFSIIPFQLSLKEKTEIQKIQIIK